jgi:hypothetical protein
MYLFTNVMLYYGRLALHFLYGIKQSLYSVFLYIFRKFFYFEIYSTSIEVLSNMKFHAKDEL